MAICLLPARGRSLAAIITDSYSAFELLLGTWPYASYYSVGAFSRSYQTSYYSAFELLLLGTWLSALPAHGRPLAAIIR